MNNNANCSIYLARPLIAALERKASERRITRNEWMREAIAAYLALPDPPDVSTVLPVRPKGHGGKRAGAGSPKGKVTGRGKYKRVREIIQSGASFLE
jgi:hypothetical protein